MTVPIDYQASAEFGQFLLDPRETLDLQTTHQAWGVLLGVIDTLRRRLNAENALTFKGTPAADEIGHCARLADRPTSCLPSAAAEYWRRKS